RCCRHQVADVIDRAHVKRHSRGSWTIDWRGELPGEIHGARCSGGTGGPKSVRGVAALLPIGRITHMLPVPPITTKRTPRMNGLPASQTAEADDRPRMARIGDTPRLTDRAYRALKDYITSLSIYDQPGEVRIDERQLAENLGISRTPVREAVVQLEREGFVRSVPRRGIYIIRKTKRDV